MDQMYQGSNLDQSADVPVKRKRGRPRKYPRLDLEDKARMPKDWSFNHGENVRSPSGFAEVNGNQPHQFDSIHNANDGMVGQLVSGVIEAAFDAGYLLSVRVGNYDTTLRGVVFKPGHYVPVSADNDVAPEMQMIKRNMVPLPAENYSRVHCSKPQSRAKEQNFGSHRNGTHPLSEVPIKNQVVPQSASLVDSKGKQVPSIGIQTAHHVIPKAKVVPVVLQPVNGVALANQPSPGAIQAAHLVASLSKQVVGDAQSSDGSALDNQVPKVINSVPPPQSQASDKVTPKGLQSDGVPSSQPPGEVLPDLEDKMMRFPGVPLEKPLTEFSEKIQAPLASVKTEIEDSKLAGKTSFKDSGHRQKDQVDDMDRPLLIEPLQAVQPDLRNQPDPALKPFENNMTGRMSELLQVLQDNAMENEVPRAEEAARASVLKLDELTSPEGNLGDKETGHPETQS